MLQKRVLIYLICEVAFFAGVVIPTMLAIPEHKMVINRPMRAVVVGVICDVFNVIMYSSPLFIVRDVIRTKSVKYMPIYLSVTNFLNGCCWTGYALIGKIDYFILVILKLFHFYFLAEVFTTYLALINFYITYI